jgi:SH3-like domain-containing protein
VTRAAGLLLATTAVQALAAGVFAATGVPSASVPATGVPATAYVSDELVLGVYSEENSQGQRLATLHSGATLQTLGVSGEFTQVRLPDGTTGWVKSSYLTTKEPAVVRVKQLQDELDRTRATTPGLAEAAARNEVLQLKRELDEARAAERSAPVVQGGPVVASSASAMRPAMPVISAWLAGAGVLAALVGGFWLGYATLARRVRARFGGLRVY